MIRIPCHPAIGIHGWEFQITPEIAAQIVGVGQKAIMEAGPPEPFLGAAHQSELEKAYSDLEAERTLNIYLRRDLDIVTEQRDIAEAMVRLLIM